MNVTIRRAKISDLETLVQFTAQEALDAEGAEITPSTLRAGIKAVLENENLALYWVLVDEFDRLLGAVSALREWSNWRAGFYWWIQSLYILPAYRGRGYVLKLMDAVAGEARAQAGLDLRLYAHKNNLRAVRAYGKTGFSETDYRIFVRALS